VQRGARVETAGERDADLLADGKILQDVRHVEAGRYAMASILADAFREDPVERAADALAAQGRRPAEACSQLAATER
jgi:hypothetical protein